MEKLGKRLEALMFFRGMTPSELAQKCGVTRQSISYWKSGRNHPTEAYSKKLADALGCSPVWLVTGQGDPPEGFGNIRAIDSEEEVPAGFVAVKEFHLTFAAGVGIEPTWEEINESENVYYKASFFEKRHIKPERCKRARVSGDSMSPLINSGDVILFYSELDPNPQFVRIADGAVYCLAVDGNLKIKRLTTSKAGITLISENEQKYPPEIFTGEEVERLRIYGRVLEVVHSL